MTESQESWTPYHYVYNNPVLRTDPDGRCPDGDCPTLVDILKDTGKDLAVSFMNVGFMAEHPLTAMKQGGNTRAYRDENGDIKVGIRPLASNGREFVGNMVSDALDGANVAATLTTGAGGLAANGGLLLAKTGGKAVVTNGVIQKVKGALPEGSFSISDWSAYPTAGGVPKPSGPFRLLDNVEYDVALKAKNKENAALHRSDPAAKGKDIHEVHPVKFGGSPTDPANKIYLDPAVHSQYTTFWNNMMKDILRKVK